MSDTSNIPLITDDLTIDGPAGDLVDPVSRDEAISASSPASAW